MSTVPTRSLVPDKIDPDVALMLVVYTVVCSQTPLRSQGYRLSPFALAKRVIADWTDLPAQKMAEYYAIKNFLTHAINSRHSSRPHAPTMEVRWGE